MKALTIAPGEPNSARLDEVPEPAAHHGTVVVDVVAVGVCGTDREMLEGKYGEAPPGESRLILGHEALGRVREAPPDSGFAAGDWVVPIVRRPDPVPCANCAAGEWDMCRNGRYTEHGIKGLHGFAAECCRMPPQFLVPVDGRLEEGAAGVLLEPASIVAKAWDHIERIGRRTLWRPRHVLVTGAGPIGLLAALMAVQRGFTVTLLDRHTVGPKPRLAGTLGVQYDTGDPAAAAADADVIVECTGAGQVILDVIGAAPRNAIVCLAGLSSAERRIQVDMGAVGSSLVLENNVVFGSVNANRTHYELAAQALAAADPAWLRGLISRRAPLDAWAEALERRDDDVKVVITPSAAQPPAPSNPAM
jgi:threonine dehydrogenase-like Zn-dependent dehydrogenase